MVYNALEAAQCPQHTPVSPDKTIKAGLPWPPINMATDCGGLRLCIVLKLSLLLLPVFQARGFLEYNRAPLGYRPVDERVTDWGEVMENAPAAAREDQLSTQVRRRSHQGTYLCCSTTHGVILDASLYCRRG